MTQPAPSSERRIEGDWSWQAASGTLAVQADGDLSYLTGDWDLAAFSLQLEGLSRARLHRTFKTQIRRAADKLKGVRCPLVLSNGKRIALTGQFTEPGIARGQLVTAETPNMEPLTNPGPNLTPAFQPIVSLKTGEAVGFEALARWDNMEGATDKDFEDPALASNMLIRSAEALDMWRRYTDRDDLWVQVNLMPQDLQNDDLPGLIEALMAGYKLPKGGLKVELTEHVALRSMSEAKRILERLTACGASIILDDFGSGHSSFAWLAEIEAEGLKTDAVLTQRMHHPRTRIVLEAVTALAGRLGMTTIAEGIEDLDDIKTAREIGFDYAQGFALARPMFADAAIDYLVIG